jgi:hypothetical protein
MDTAYHISVLVYKVNFDGKSVYDMMKIYMVIDIVFTKLRITKVSLLFFSPRWMKLCCARCTACGNRLLRLKGLFRSL